MAQGSLPLTGGVSACTAAHIVPPAGCNPCSPEPCSRFRRGSEATMRPFQCLGDSCAMFSHIMIGTNNLVTSKVFYDAVLGVLEVPPGAVDRHRIF